MSSIFLPDIFAETVFDIDINQLKNEGIKAFIFDIDNTLATYAMPVADKKTALWINDLKNQGFGVFVVSNNSRERVRVFAQDLDIPYFGKALKPLSYFLKKACRHMGVRLSETALVGDQLFTDIWGGSVLGMKTILVKPISDVEDGFVRFKRRFERRILAKMQNTGE